MEAVTRVFRPTGAGLLTLSGAKGILAESKVFVMPAGGGAAEADCRRYSVERLAGVVAGRATPFGAGRRSNERPGFAGILAGFARGRSLSEDRTGLLASGAAGALLVQAGSSWIGSEMPCSLGAALRSGRSGSRMVRCSLENSGNWLRARHEMVDVRGSALKLVFESRTSASHLWSLPLELNSGKVRGPMQPLPHAGGSQTMPASSSDGSRLVYLQSGPNSQELRLRDMNSGTERVLSTGRARPKISPDGTKVAYAVGPPGPLFLMDSSGGEATKLLDPAGGVTIYGWSADGKRIVYWDGTPIRFSVFDLETRQTSELISHPTYDIHGAELSPDGKWVAFHLPRPVSEPLKIAPVREGKAAAEAEWITVADTAGSNRRPWWSPDGNLLYFLSTRDNYKCIWAQPLDPATKRPRGEPMAVYHFHETRRSLSDSGTASFGPAVGGGRIVFALGEQSGNIWLAEPGATER